jgi:mRNA N6-methyladenine demethylase
MQFGACYNYARDSEGRDPGIIPEEVVEPMPPLLKALARRLVRWGVLPASKEPDSAIINLYEEGDCIPPHIDHHDFSRPFCTLSLLSRQSIMFGRRLVPQGPGEFVELGDRALHIPLAPGSCLVLKGNGADLAMHCVPPVSDRRISITLRKMGAPHRDLVLKEAKDVAAAEGHPDARLKGFWEC